MQAVVSKAEMKCFPLGGFKCYKGDTHTHTHTHTHIYIYVYLCVCACNPTAQVSTLRQNETLCGYKLCDQSSTIPFMLGGGKAHWTFQMDYSGWATVGKQQINELRMELRYLDHWAFSVSHSICGNLCGGGMQERHMLLANWWQR